MIKVNGNEVLFEKFPNGETRIIESSLPQVGWVIKNIALKYEDDSDLIKLMLIKNYLDSIGRKGFNELIIYYMPYSRMDRSENGSPFTLKYVANFINNLGFSKVKVIEPHSDVTPALIDNVEPVYINFDLIEKVKREVTFREDKDYLMFPDAGASKRYSKMKAKNVLIGNKVRDFETGKILGLELMGDKSKAYGRSVIIVDDLSSRGSTFVHSAKKLREEGFVEINLLVAHAENTIFEGELFDHIDKVFTTDSILTDHLKWENVKESANKLKIYDIEEMINMG